MKPDNQLKGFVRHTAVKSRLITILLTVLLFIIGTDLSAQSTNETVSAGSFIVNMGVTPQTAGNGLKPYGMIYDLIDNYQVPIKWVINDSKAKDGTDFTYNGVDFKGGPFIIPGEFRNAAVNARITFWQGEGVIGTTTTAPITVPVFATLTFAPNWTLDLENGGLLTGGKKGGSFFEEAGIPESAYGGTDQSNWKLPADLGPCDDIFAMPHADPEWETHQNLLDWNLSSFGSIWYGCHAGSALENMFNPATPSEQTNFLAEKTATATGGGPYANNNGGDGNSLILWGEHDDASFPLAYDYPSDPIMQFMGPIDDATDNGSEQIYIPVNTAGGWRPTSFPGIYDPDNVERPGQPGSDVEYRAAVTAWGRGFGDPNRGWVLMQGAHNVFKADDPENIAAVRIFYNLAFRAVIGKRVIPSVNELTAGANIAPGEPIDLSITIPPPAMASDFTVEWTSTCGGTFTPSNTSFNPTFTPPSGSGALECAISAVITDPCGFTSFSSTTVNVVCDLEVSTALTLPCGTGALGAIDYTVTGGANPTYTWTRAEGGTGSGSGTSIPSLDAGTYTVNITTDNGCTTSFTRILSGSPSIILTPTDNPVACFGESTGGISLSVSGGTPGFTYAWSDGPTTQNRSGIPAGTYTVTVTDANGCTETTTATVTEPTAALAVTPTVTDILCFGEATGAIDLAVSGGTPAYTYLWNNGQTVQNPTGLTPGTYSVTVTDANNCTETATSITITQPASAVSAAITSVTDADCGEAVGAITVTASGGTSPYMYDWSGTPSGDGTPTITNLSGGSYLVTVTDDNGCTVVLSQTINQTSAISLALTPMNPTCPPSGDPPFNSDGVINLTVTGGTPNYTYAWTTSDGSGLNPTAEDQTGLTSGTYNVTVTGANGCTASASVTLVNENQLPVTPGAIDNN